MSQIIPLLLGGLGLFLYAIFRLSDVLKTMFSEKAKGIVAKYTSNTFLAILIGVVATIILDSSSAVIIMVIVFINSKVLSFRQAMGIILGANIGTTFSSKIIAMAIGKYSIIPLLLGLVVMIFAKNVKVKRISTVVLYFGMLFFGLFIIEQSVFPLRNSETFAQWMSTIENNPIQGALIGGLVTLIIQSSSGTVGMAIVLGKQNILSLTGGLAIMLGAELGTCSDTLIATLGGSRQALKAALFHLSYSLSTIIVALVLFAPFVELVQKVSGGQQLGNQIANGHVIFNVLGVLFWLPFLNVTERLLNKLLPDKPTNKPESLPES